MAMMDWLEKIINDTKISIKAEVARFNNRPFMEGVVAGCALVAASDGKISDEEKAKMAGFLQVSEELKVFSTAEVISHFGKIANAMEFDFGLGRMEAMKYIERLKTNPAAAKVMVRVCCVIGASDGNFDEKEKNVVRDICKSVNVNPKEFDL